MILNSSFVADAEECSYAVFYFCASRSGTFQYSELLQMRPREATDSKDIRGKQISGIDKEFVLFIVADSN